MAADWPRREEKYMYRPIPCWNMAARVLPWGMDLFTLSEEKALLFHRAIMGLVQQHPNLLVRARRQLKDQRRRAPNQDMIWDRWAALLDKSVVDLAPVILADTPDGGLLRAHSPLGAALDVSERKAVWQRIGLIQFFQHYLIAVDDLDFAPHEQAAMTGLDEADLVRWRATGPGELPKAALESLKLVVALHKSLNGVSDSVDVRRRWLRLRSETFEAAPMDLLTGGEIARVVDSLAGAVRLTLGPADMPRM